MLRSSRSITALRPAMRAKGKPLAASAAFSFCSAATTSGARATVPATRPRDAASGNPGGSAVPGAGSRAMAWKR